MDRTGLPVRQVGQPYNRTRQEDETGGGDEVSPVPLPPVSERRLPTNPLAAARRSPGLADGRDRLDCLPGREPSQCDCPGLHRPAGILFGQAAVAHESLDH